MSTHYSWPSGSLITHMVSTPEEESLANTVYLFASEGTKPGGMQPLIAQLQQAGYDDLYPDIRDGKHCLAIRHVRHPDRLIDMISDRGWASGILERTHEADTSTQDDIFHPSFWRHYSMRTTASFALSGQLLRYSGAWLQRDVSQQLSLIWAGVMTAVGLAYNTGTGKYAEEMLRHAQYEMHKQGQDSRHSLHDTADYSVAYQAKRWVQQHPVLIYYGGGIPSNLLSIRSGLRHNHRWQVIRSSIYALSNSIITFVPERVRSVEEQEQSIAEEVRDDWMFIPNALSYTIRHPAETPGMLWDYAQASPKRLASKLTLPIIATSWLDSWEQSKNARGGWAIKNPSRIAALRTQQDAIRTGKPALTIRDTRNWGAIESRIRILERQVALTKGLPRQLIPACMMGGSALATLAVLIQSIGSKNRLSQQVDMTTFDKLYSLTAQSLLAAPESQRQQLFDSMTDYLAQQHDLVHGHITRDTLRNEIHIRMEQFGQSPWISSPQPGEQRAMGIKDDTAGFLR